MLEARRVVSQKKSWTRLADTENANGRPDQDRVGDSIPSRRKEDHTATTLPGGLIDRVLDCISVIRTAVTLSFYGDGARIIRCRFESGRCSEDRPRCRQQGGRGGAGQGS